MVNNRDTVRESDREREREREGGGDNVCIVKGRRSYRSQTKGIVLYLSSNLINFWRLHGSHTSLLSAVVSLSSFLS